jgi:hypothetical protein
LKKKLCSDLGAGIEPGRGGTLSWESNALPQSYKVIPKKIQKKTPYILWAKTCHVLPIGLLIGSGHLGTRLLIG